MIAIKGMLGLGDNIYQRAFVKSLVRSREVLLETPWPEIYQDLPNMQFLKPETRLRTQRKSLERVPKAVWSKPYYGHARKISYSDRGMMRGMREAFGVDSSAFDLPDFDSPIKGDYAVIRPATVRTEWMASSRNPKPEYIAECADILLQRGIKVISVADLQDKQEWALEPLPKATETYHKGEFSVTQLLGLIQHAKVVVGGVGWLTPASIAYRVPSWIIFGGYGAFNSPENLFDAGRMDLSNVGYALPNDFCRCRDSSHNCRKEISNHAAKFTEWLGRFPNLVSRERHGVSSA
jgi:hypothetical protein